MQFRDRVTAGPGREVSQGTCRLESLRRWDPSNHLAGLVSAGGSAQLDTKFFECCRGEGFQMTEVPNSAAGCRPCGLASKTALVGEFCEQLAGSIRTRLDLCALGFRNEGGQANLQYLEKIERWRRLHAVSFMTHGRGRLIADAERAAGGMSDLWPGLFSLVWHDSLIPLMHLHGSGVPTISKWASRLQRAHTLKMRAVIVIDGVQQLWTPQYLEELEQVIAFASQTLTPLWIVLKPGAPTAPIAVADARKTPNPEPTGARSTRFSAGLSERLDKYRRGPIEKWLNDGTLARLSEVCELPSVKQRRS